MTNPYETRSQKRESRLALALALALFDQTYEFIPCVCDHHFSRAVSYELRAGHVHDQSGHKPALCLPGHACSRKENSLAHSNLNLTIPALGQKTAVPRASTRKA
jgi:hypothetical protein